MAVHAHQLVCLIVLLWPFSFFGSAIAHTHQTRRNILAPNISSCQRPTFGVSLTDLPGLNCCFPKHRRILTNADAKLFKPNRIPQGKRRVRRAAHRVDEAYAQRLARAYSLMRALPTDDPRSFLQQANIHCAYCDGSYKQMDSTTQYFQVHGSWLFLPFHRWYVYFHERILAKLLELEGDGESLYGSEPFALTFWNYDHPNGSNIPWLFRQLPELHDPNRNHLHELPTSIVALNCNPNTDMVPPHVQLQENAHVLYRSMIRDATSPSKFFGQPYARGDPPLPGGGTVEEGPHNAVHEWTGNFHTPDGRDMGNFHATARDPVFFAHHAQVDRLWEIWKSFKGNHNLRDKRLLDAEFVFYNEDAELVRVRAGDAMHIKQLGYEYEDVEMPWKQAIPIRLSRGAARMSGNQTLCSLGKPILWPCSVVLERNPTYTMGTAQKQPQAIEHLVMTGLFWQVNTQTYFDIYLNLPSADQRTTSGCLEYVNFYESYPQTLIGVHTLASLEFDITDRIRDLGLEKEDNIVVTIVPKLGSSDGTSSPPSITMFSIRYT